MRRSTCGLTSVVAAVSALGVSAGPATGQAFGGERAEGVIVAVRADIVQIRPRYSDALVRVVMDANTRINDTEMLPFDRLGPGWRINVFGNLESETDFRPNFVMALSPTERRSGFFEFPSRGIQKMGFGKSAIAGGKIKSTKPFVITDDDGKEIPLKFAGPVMVMHPTLAGKDKLLVGKMIFANGERTSDGLLRARTIGFNPMFGGSPGGALYGRVQSQAGDRLRVVPLYVEEAIRVSPAEKAVILRQIALDPDTVQVGDLITVQGVRTGGTAEAPEVMRASMLLAGKQEYPIAPQGGGFAMLGGGAPANFVWTGKVVSLAPLMVSGANDRHVRVVVPGQTPFIDLKPARLSDAKPGERIMLSGKDGQDGGMSAMIIVFGAGPIGGFGG